MIFESGDAMLLVIISPAIQKLKMQKQDPIPYTDDYWNIVMEYKRKLNNIKNINWKEYVALILYICLEKMFKGFSFSHRSFDKKLQAIQQEMLQKATLTELTEIDEIAIMALFYDVFT